MIQRSLLLPSMIESAVSMIREYEPAEGYYLCFSGGKDSGVLKTLADMAGVQYEAHFHRTTVDPPEVIRFTKERHPDVVLDKPADSMFKLIVRMGIPPTRRIRYCCRILKEDFGAGRIVLTGVRRSESGHRANRQFVYSCPSKSKITINPLLLWSEDDVWDFIFSHDIPYCNLYSNGFKRIGCIGCPNAGKKRLEQFERWPRFYNAYMHCFDLMLVERECKGKRTTWKTAVDVMEWWLEELLTCSLLEIWRLWDRERSRCAEW